MLRAATATRAPAAESAKDVARPIPCDAPVTNATLPLSENIRSGLGCIRARLLNLFERSLQAGGILDSDAANRPIDLSHEPAQYFSWPDLDKHVDAAFDHVVNGIKPSDWQANLPDQRLARFVAAGDGLRIRVRHQRKAQIVEIYVPQIRLEMILRRHHE